MNRLYKNPAPRSNLSALPVQSKIQLLNALIASKRAELSSPDARIANNAKGALIGLYRAKKYLENMLQAEAA